MVLQTTHHLTNLLFTTLNFALIITYFNFTAYDIITLPICLKILIKLKSRKTKQNLSIYNYQQKKNAKVTVLFYIFKNFSCKTWYYVPNVSLSITKTIICGYYKMIGWISNTKNTFAITVKTFLRKQLRHLKKQICIDYYSEVPTKRSDYYKLFLFYYLQIKWYAYVL